MVRTPRTSFITSNVFLNEWPSVKGYLKSGDDKHNPIYISRSHPSREGCCRTVLLLINPKLLIQTEIKVLLILHIIGGGCVCFNVATLSDPRPVQGRIIGWEKNCHLQQLIRRNALKNIHCSIKLQTTEHSF